MTKYKSNYQNRREQGWLAAYVFYRAEDKPHLLEVTGEQSPAKAAQHILNAHLKTPLESRGIEARERRTLPMAKIDSERLTTEEWDNVVALYRKLKRLGVRTAYSQAYAYSCALAQAKGKEPYSDTRFEDAYKERPSWFTTPFIEDLYSKYHDDFYQALMDSVG